MNLFQGIDSASDRIMETLVSGLAIEFGPGVSGSLIACFLEAEEADFIWDARTSERWIGAYEGAEYEAIELDRIAVSGSLNGHFYCAICLVDGDGMVHGLLERRLFSSEMTARDACIAMATEVH